MPANLDNLSMPMASLMAQLIKNLCAMWETWVWSLGWEDPLEEDMATHSSILAWGISMECIVHGVAKSWIQLSNFHFTLHGHSTGKGQVLFQSQRRAMPKKFQTTAQLHSFHMLARSFSKSSKLGFNNTWTKNFHMYKLDLEKAEEPEIKLPTFAGS